MDDFWTALLTAIGLVLVMEGLLYAAAPESMQRLMARLLETPPPQLRQAGVLAVALGVLVIWLVRQL